MDMRSITIVVCSSTPNRYTGTMMLQLIVRSRNDLDMCAKGDNINVDVFRI